MGKGDEFVEKDLKIFQFICPRKLAGLAGVLFPVAMAFAPVNLDARELRLNSARSSYKVNPVAEYQIGSPNAASPVARQWRGPRDSNFGFGKETIWLRWKVSNRTEASQWLLVLPTPWIDSVRLYESVPGGLRLLGNAGDELPYARRPYVHRYQILRLRIAPGTQREYVARVESTLLRDLSFRVMTEETLHARERPVLTAFAMYGGLALLLLGLNLICFLNYRSSVPVLYAGILIMFFAYQAALEGFVYQYLPGLSPHWRDRSYYIFTGAAIGLMAFFAPRTLLMRIHVPRLSRLLWPFRALALVMILGVCLPDEYLNALNTFGMLVFAGFVIYLIAATSLTARQGFPPAILSGIGISIWVGSIGLVLLADLGLYQHGPFTRFLPLAGSFLDMLFFLAALFARIRLLVPYSGRTGFWSEKVAVQRYGEERNRYKKSKLAGVSVAPVLRELHRLMSVEKLYRDDELTVAGLAERLRISGQQLSELLNARENQSFHHFINKFRVEEAARTLRADPERTVLSAALEAGFNSKSSFNTEFKRVFGVTPTQYRNGTRLPQSPGNGKKGV